MSKEVKTSVVSNMTCWICVLLISPRLYNLNVSGYKSRSFRIGAASWAAAKGLSDELLGDGNQTSFSGTFGRRLCAVVPLHYIAYLMY